MRSRPPYIIRTEDDEQVADTLEAAIAEAADMYDPASSVPEIVDADGRIVFDQSEIVARIR